MNTEYDKFDNAKNCTGKKQSRHIFIISHNYFPLHQCLFLFSGPRNYKRSFHSGVIPCLGLLSFFLLIGLITLGVYCESDSNTHEPTYEQNKMSRTLYFGWFQTMLNEL